jgi:hypothetical protein
MFGQESESLKFGELVPWKYTAAWQRSAIILAEVQALALFVAFVVSILEVETILGTGLAVTVTGYAFAVYTWSLRSWRVLVYGLSGPLGISVLAAVIAAFQLGPDEGVIVIPCVLGAWMLISTPLFPSAVHVIKSRPIDFPVFQWSIRLPKQFSLKSMFTTTTVLAVVLVIARWIYLAVHGPEFRAFAGFAAVNFFVCCMLAQLFAMDYGRR